MNNQYKVSVIIAAYNSEKFLPEMLDSLVAQTMNYTEYEIIIVNDGSTDETYDILCDYKKRYKNNFVIICKENGGPSSARNVGLDYCRGDYVFFLDADDILEATALEVMYDAIVNQKADLAIAKYDMFNHDKHIPVRELDNLVSLDVIEKYDPQILSTFTLWNKLFCRKLIKNLKLKFAPLSYSEDGAFLMEYLFHCKKIVGVNQIVLHYRKQTQENAVSITGSVTLKKINDYITAHNLILKSAENSFLRDYTKYDSIEAAKTCNVMIHNYLNDIVRKELSILIKRFYAFFWSLDEPTVGKIIDEISRQLKMLDMRTKALLEDAFYGFSLRKLYRTQKEVLDNAFFTAVLYGTEEDTSEFLRCLRSLTTQTFIFLKIIVPSHMRTVIEAEEMVRGNIQFMECASENELFHRALDAAATPYIFFCDQRMVYSDNALRAIYRRISKNYYDFIVDMIYHQEYGDIQPLIYQSIVFQAMEAGIEPRPCLCMDAVLANKYFSVCFLKEQVRNNDTELLYVLNRCYRNGYYAYAKSRAIIYQGTEQSFKQYIETQESHSYIEQYMKDEPVSLKNKELEYVPGENAKKYIELDEDDELGSLVWELLSKYRIKEPKDQILFISLRGNDALEDNALALYPYIKGKKIICAKKLPHDLKTARMMIVNILESKVIVTDDYVEYLQFLPLHSEQRVIQIWHACGAFKKFGQRETNISISVDQATHARYNLVTVSSEAVRAIYADAFDVNYKKVRALGCPRTDAFFDEKMIRRIRRKIYLRHPGWRKKFVILYAPTFRDVGGDRTQFHPELDFDRLSAQLLPDQILLVCPHPVMTNDILQKKYPNIREMKNYSTNDLMYISDMLITDYSSVIFEYALFRKPIAFYCYDLTTYDRGFYLNYPEDLPGEIYRNQEELTAYLRNPEEHIVTKKYDDFVNKYMSACDGHSCERIAGLINDYMEGR